MSTQDFPFSDYAEDDEELWPCRVTYWAFEPIEPEPDESPWPLIVACILYFALCATVLGFAIACVRSK